MFKRVVTSIGFGPLCFCFFLTILPGTANSTSVEAGPDGGSYRLEEFITTHFTATGGDGQYGGEAETGYLHPYYGKDADLRFLNQEKDGIPLDPAVSPAYEKYHNQTTASTAVKVKADRSNDRDFDGVPDEIEDFEADVFSRTGYHVDILNYDPSRPVSEYLYEYSRNVQLLNNVIYKTSLFTITFPPGWHRDRELPIVLMGHGYTEDNNAMYVKGHTVCAVYAALSVRYGNGLIFVQSNCGGRESLGIHENAIRDVGEFLTRVLPRYGGDPDKVITMGASRAGNVALVWAANPYGYEYNVRSIHAFSPPVKVGSMLRLSRATFHSLNGVVNTALGSNRAYRSDYRSSVGDVLDPGTKAEAVTRVLLGTSKTDEADYRSAFGCYIHQNLAPSLQEKRIVITYGTHDSFMPMNCFLDFDRKLTHDGIYHVSAIGYGYGHSNAFADCEGDQRFVIKRLINDKEIRPFSQEENRRIFFMPKKLYNPGDGTVRKGAIKITDWVIDYINCQRPGYFPPDHGPTTLAFSATLPYRVRTSRPMTITLMGEKGKSWKIWARPEAGYRPVYSMSGVFGEVLDHPHVFDWSDEYVVLHLQTNVSPGRYEWFFQYDGREIPNRFTPYISPDGVFAKAVTHVVDEEPAIDDYRFESDCWTNFGVDQYHPSLAEPTEDPSIRVHPERMIRAKCGTTITLRFSAVDPDGDEVIYDLRTVRGDFPSRALNIRLNGLTGGFDFRPTTEDVGHHRFKVIAKDGKGGIGEEYVDLIVY